jgi:hypothetical protein
MHSEQSTNEFLDFENGSSQLCLLLCGEGEKEFLDVFLIVIT